MNSPLDTMDMVAAGGDGVEEVNSGGGGGDGGTLTVTEGLNKRLDSRRIRTVEVESFLRV